MTFRELIALLSKRIGHHQIPLNPEATELRGLIDSGAVHYELITQIVTALYTGNRCRQLHDPVAQDASFEALEPIRLAVLRAPGTDVDVHGLMESICAEVAHAFGVATPNKRPAAPTSSGELVRFRRRLRFM
jgi:hypothetical protein